VRISYSVPVCAKGSPSNETGGDIYECTLADSYPAWLKADCLPGHVELATRGADGQTISLPDLTAELAQIRAQGFATDDAAAAGIQCVAAPVFGLTGLKGAIGVSLLRGSAPSLDPVADDVKTAAARATIALGGTTPNHHVLPRNDHADQTSVARR